MIERKMAPAVIAEAMKTKQRPLLSEAGLVPWEEEGNPTSKPPKHREEPEI